MKTLADKTQEGEKQSVASAIPGIQAGCEPTFQFVDNRPEAIAQRKLQEMANNSPQVKRLAQLQTMSVKHSAEQQRIQKKQNKTGLPDDLKSGIVSVSGYSMDNVKVHYNSDRPAQLQAHAYAQGADIHLGPGQEKHLPHEAWHVVQQKQGRVKPTLQMKGIVNVNDDEGLEREADQLGLKASSFFGVSTAPLNENNTSVNPTIQRFTDEVMEEFRRKRAEEQAAELDQIASLEKVSSFFGVTWTEKVWNVQKIVVGVTFRTDGRGSAHAQHDMVAVYAMNKLGLPFTVEGVALPRDAKGEISPDRIAKKGELDGIDMLYVPGGPTANDTQTGATEEDANFMRLQAPQVVNDPGNFTGVKPQKPQAPAFDRSDPLGSKTRIAEYEQSQDFKQYKQLNSQYLAARKQHEQLAAAYQQYLDDIKKYDRKNKEHTERASYELALIKIAKTKGIPIMAVCAGSWRLLESYGGEVRTLPPQERDVHRASGNQGAWDISHDIELVPTSMMGGMMKQSGTMKDVNTTHWAIASENEQGQLSTATDREDPNKFREDPNKLLTVSARTGGDTTRTLVEPTEQTPEITPTSPNEKTVEGFESNFGAPVIGAQWHPEGYLPGMQGENSGSTEIQQGSKNMFKAMAEAAATSQSRRLGLCSNVGKQEAAFDMLKQSIVQYLERSPVAAGIIYHNLIAIWPKEKWSEDMLSVDAMVEEINAYRNMDQSSEEAGNVFIGIKSKLKDFGITV